MITIQVGEPRSQMAWTPLTQHEAFTPFHHASHAWSPGDPSCHGDRGGSCHRFHTRCVSHPFGPLFCLPWPMPKREKQISAWIRKASSPHLPVKENDWFNQGMPPPGLIARIHSEDPDSVMPPPESFLTLNPDEKATLSQWINEGASWGKHWAFERVVAPKIPRWTGFLRPLTPLMPSLKRRFRSRVSPPGRRPPGASPSPRPSGFDRFTPSPDTLERFLSDPDPLAYERMVDQLLASEHYGERMAMEWLDVARFADTYGYQSGRFNHLWPWRDWVIAAFNDNLSYDTFILHQMAGDLIDQPTQQTFWRPPSTATIDRPTRAVASTKNSGWNTTQIVSRPPHWPSWV